MLVGAPRLFGPVTLLSALSALSLAGAGSTQREPLLERGLPEPSPPAVPAAQQLTIVDVVQATNRNFVPDRLGQRVRVTGTVTTEPFSIAGLATITYIQADAGIALYSSDRNLLAGLAPGDRVEVTGVVGQFRAQEMITVDSVTTVDKSGVPSVLPIEARDAGARYSAMLVEVKGRLIIRDQGGSVVADIVDESGTLPVYLGPALLANPRLFQRILDSDGRHVRVRGILLQDAEEAGEDTGYYITPRSGADLDLPLTLPIQEIGGALIALLLIASIIHLWLKRSRAERTAAAQSALAAKLRASEAALRVSEQRYRTLFENVPIGLFQMALDGSLISANAMLARILEYPSVADLLDAGLSDHFVERESGIWLRQLAERSSGVTGFETRWLRRSGTTLVIRMNAHAVRRDTGEISYIEGTVEDITDRFHAEERLREAEGRMRQFTRTSPAILYVLSVSNGKPRMTWVSESVTRILGYPLDEPLRVSWWMDSLHPEDREEAVRVFRDFLAGRSPTDEISHEYRFRHADGTYRWFRNDLRIVSRGEVVEAVGSSLDITAQKDAALALYHAEARYRRLVETSPYGIFIADAGGRLTEVNPALGEIAGAKPQEVVGRSLLDLLALEHHERICEEIERLRKDPAAPADYEAVVVRPDGERRIVHIRAIPIVSDGDLVGAHGVMRDLTEERGRENRIHLLGTALENLGHGVAVSDADGTLIYVNSEYANLLAFDPAESISSDRFVPDDAAWQQLAEIREALRRSGRWTGRVWRRRVGDGRVIPLDAVIGMVPDAHGGKGRSLMICHDASETMHHEQQLRRAERLSSLGTLVGGVAHELNNPLNAIINFAGLLLESCDEPESLEDLQTIVREGERAAKIVSNLRFIARHAQIDQSPREPVDVNDVVAHVLKLRGYSLATSNIAVTTDLAGDIPRVWADRGQVEQVLLNLVINAEQAMAANHAEGRLTVRTLSGRLGVRIEVSDDGPGIPSSDLERIFDPFWTTKAPGEGTGLGLSVVHNIVVEHGGSVRVVSENGSGATFLVDLPEVRADATEDSAKERFSDPPALEPIRILVVDDEAAVRRSIVRYLQREGHHVHEATEGEEALARIRENGGYDVILSDIRMPGMNGEQLLRRLQMDGEGNDRKLVFMTGDPTGAEAAAVNGEAPLLIKPIQLVEVTRAIHERVTTRHRAMVSRVA